MNRIRVLFVATLLMLLTGCEIRARLESTPTVEQNVVRWMPVGPERAGAANLYRILDEEYGVVCYRMSGYNNISCTTLWGGQ